MNRTSYKGKFCKPLTIKDRIRIAKIFIRGRYGLLVAVDRVWRE
jgi:hypothetical protein